MDESVTRADRPNPLGHAPVGGLIRQFAIPSIISMLVSSAYNITDQIFIGHIVGMLGNAATNVAFPTVSLAMALAQLAGVGTAASYNLNLGRGKRKAAAEYLGTGLTFLMLLGVILGAVVFLLRDPILRLCGATDAVFPYGQSYLGITALGLPFHLASTGASTLIRGDGSPRYSMACTVSGAVVNIVLDWLFMMVFQWGIQGAALATVLGQVLSFLLCLRYLPRFKGVRVTRQTLKLRADKVKEICQLGTANFLNHIMMMVVNIVMNNLLSKYGALSIYGSDIPLAVSGIIAKVQTIVISFSVGLAHGCQPIFSFNMGAGKYSRVRLAYRKALIVALLIGLVAFALFQLFPHQIAAIFGSGDPLYFQFAEEYLQIFLFMICVTGVQPLSVNYFTSIGNVRQGTVLSASRQGLFLLPLLAVLPQLWGLEGILYAGPIAEGCACTLALVSVWRSIRRLPRQDKLPAPPEEG